MFGGLSLVLATYALSQNITQEQESETQSSSTTEAIPSPAVHSQPQVIPHPTINSQPRPIDPFAELVPSSGANSQPQVIPSPTVHSQPQAIGSFTKEHICRATIAAIMGRDPRIIRVDNVNGEVVYTSYVRPDDGTHWANRCQVDQTTQSIVWAADGGRWRTDPLDERITYSVNGTTLTIVQQFSDGSASEDAFTLEQLS